MATPSQANRSVETYWAAALAFNKSLAVPCRWKVAQKVQRKSGRGMYDYVNPRSDYHVLVLDDVKQGRFKRVKGKFLCTNKIKDQPLHDFVNMNELDAEESKKNHKVTCKGCLDRAKKLK
jgi:hypothetical protein